MAELKRELITKLNSCIIAMTDMSSDAAKLDLSDNAEASKRLKKRLANFQSEELKDFKDAVYVTRHDIITKPKEKKVDGRSKNFLNLRKGIVMPGAPDVGNEEDF